MKTAKEEIKELISRAKELTPRELYKEIMALRESMTLEEIEELKAVIGGAGKLLKVYEILTKEKEKLRKKWAKEHPWMGNPYV